MQMNWLKENVFSILLFFAVMGIMLYGFNDAAQSSSEEQMRMTEDSLRRAVVSCYALEGRYPPNVDYLQQQYGLQINEKNILSIMKYLQKISCPISQYWRGNADAKNKNSQS